MILRTVRQDVRQAGFKLQQSRQAGRIVWMPRHLIPATDVMRFAIVKSPDRRKHTVQWLPTERPIGIEIATIRSEYFYAWRQFCESHHA